MNVLHAPETSSNFCEVQTLHVPPSATLTAGKSISIFNSGRTEAVGSRRVRLDPKESTIERFRNQ